jgi:protein KRI1
LPTYAEVTNVKKRKKAVIEGDLSQEEDVQIAEGDAELIAEDAEDDFDELVEGFEASYNFRFEEP